jgi:phage replication-related protein YjqB (UPF0714/DUF867 family)
MPTDIYHNFAALAAGECPGADYRIIACPRPSPVAVIAPHGGGIEPGTSELAAAIAGQEFSLYCFEGRKSNGNETLHITSAAFDEPACLAIVAASQVVLALHGSVEQEEVVHVGGRKARLARRLCEALNAAGFAAQLDDTADHPGRDAFNICNRSRSLRGCQLEISNGLRITLFEGLTRRQRKRTTAQFHAFVTAIRSVLLTQPEAK